MYTVPRINPDSEPANTFSLLLNAACMLVNRPGLEPMIYLTHVVAIFGSNCTLSFYLASLILPLTFSITTVRTSLGRT
jgi:hypothetical protein